MGNLIASFVFDLLEDALTDIVALYSTSADPSALLRELEHDVRGDTAIFQQSTYSDSFKDIIEGASEDDSIEWDLLAHGPSYCHISVLPSEIRRKGILTEGKPVELFSRETDAISQNVYEAVSNSSDGGPMRLVYMDSDKAPEYFDCDEQLQIDFKEFFYVSWKDGWKHVVFPNDREVQEYGVSGGTFTRGVLAFCLTWCRSTCPAGDMNIADFASGNATIEINGVPVTTFTRFAQSFQECVLTGNAEGRFWKPNKDGRFDIRARVLQSEGYIRFTSFIVWHDNHRN
jgi:hypothetical protein